MHEKITLSYIIFLLFIFTLSFYYLFFEVIVFHSSTIRVALIFRGGEISVIGRSCRQLFLYILILKQS